VHLAFSVGMFVVILVFNAINDSSVVGMIFRVASYTYGPLLGLYAFGLFIKSKKVNDRLVPIICILSPALTFIINENSVNLLGGYVFDNELIIVNTLITFIGLLLTSKTVANKYQF
jgi:hypothetical protein